MQKNSVCITELIVYNIIIHYVFFKKILHGINENIGEELNLAAIWWMGIEPPN